jgi:glutamine amidotransferase
MNVTVIKLGVGNTASVMFALERLGAEPVLTDDPNIITDAERLILPGVGAAGPAMTRLAALGLENVLRTFSRPLLGICLGQQLLFERSEEGDALCLGFFPGRVAPFRGSHSMPSPHMGWSELYLDQPHHPLVEGVRSSDQAYFVHSYACPIGRETVAVAQYGPPFAAIVADNNVFGCQFHPERSGAIGARILRNFLRLPC